MKTTDFNRQFNNGDEKRKDRPYQVYSIAVIVIVWLVLSLFAWIKPSTDVSQSERRKLNQFPECSIAGIRSGSFMDKFEEAAVDQFPLREEFRCIRAVSDVYALQKKDIHGIYEADGYLAEMVYPLNESSVERAGEKCRNLYDTYMKDGDIRVYLAVIPDKGYYLGKEHGYLTADYDRFHTIMQEELEMAEVISITDTLSIEDYYTTDSHWRQEQLEETAEEILNAMDAEAFDDLREKTALDSFRGVYSGQSALPVQGEMLNYLTNDTLEECQVFNVEAGQTTGIYNVEKLEGRDPYDFFLSGSSAILMIENPTVDTGRELVVFRDSFGSSLIPLLAKSYAKITVIDTRYVNPELIGDYVEFENQDVLFLYSTILLNRSETMR